MEMAIGKVAVGLILGWAAWGQEFAVRHDHVRKHCDGTLTVDSRGIGFKGGKGHVWYWSYPEIQKLTLYPTSIHILSYKDRSSWKLGKDVAYTFTGKFPTDALQRQWSASLDQRFVDAAGGNSGLAGIKFPVKQLGLMKGTQGNLTFGESSVVFDAARDARTWRVKDIQFISSAGPFQLSITTLEKQFDFQLKQAISESIYNQLWLDIERK